MQLLAIEETGEIILARDAKKKGSYRCPECLSAVFVRSGSSVQPHFYHKERLLCRHDGKGLDHLLIQLRLHKEIPGAYMEERFLSLGRVADICSHALKIVIEIQCSSISLKELKARTEDYESLGYRVIWILHTKRFFKESIHSIEKYLEKRPHYFTNIDQQGEGMIFDHLSRMYEGKRTLLGEPLELVFSTWPLKDLGKERIKAPRQWGAYLKGYLKIAFRMALESSCHEK